MTKNFFNTEEKEKKRLAANKRRLQQYHHKRRELEKQLMKDPVAKAQIDDMVAKGQLAHKLVSKIEFSPKEDEKVEYELWNTLEQQSKRNK